MIKKTSPIVIIGPESTINIFDFLGKLSNNRIITYWPAPPQRDVLENPILLFQPPRIILRHRKFLTRASEFLFFRLLSDHQRLQRDLHYLIAGIMASVWPQTANDLCSKGWVGKFSKNSWVNLRICHPYQLSGAFETLVKIPTELQTERRALEMILSSILKEYQKRISASHDSTFSFESEARRYGLMGYRIERQMRYISSKVEFETTIQEIYNCYFNASKYYQYSLISGEPLTNDGRLFSIFCRATLFTAHVAKNGKISAHVPTQQLPPREQIMFFVLRDAALRRRYNSDPGYAEKIKTLVRLFPRP